MNFEEYLKKPFEDQEFEFKEAYWQSAEKLIDNHYKRIRWIRAGIISGVLIATLIATIFYLNMKNSHVPASDLAKKENPPYNQTSQSGLSTPALPIEENNAQNNSEPAISRVANAETGYKSSMNPASDDYKASASEKKNMTAALSSRINKDRSSGDLNDETFKHLNKTAISGSEKYALKNKDISAPHVKSDQSELLKDNTTSVNYAAFENQTQNNADVQERILSEDESQVIPSVTAIGSTESLSSLDLPFRSLEASENLHLSSFPLHLDFGSRKPILAMPRPSRIYAAAEMLMYPSGNTEAFKFLGFNAGIGYQQPLGKMAFIDMGISGSFRRGNFAPSLVSTQLNYDFGPRTDAYILRPQALYSLQVPVMLGIESGRHMIAAGVKFGFLIGVRGTSEYANYTHAFESPTGKESYSYDVVDEGWIESSGFKKFALAYALKYQYRLSSKIMLGASLQYLPSDWIANDFGKFYNFASNEYQNPSGNPVQLIERNWLLGVELKYVLFSK